MICEYGEKEQHDRLLLQFSHSGESCEGQHATYTNQHYNAVVPPPLAGGLPADDTSAGKLPEDQSVQATSGGQGGDPTENGLDQAFDKAMEEKEMIANFTCLRNRRMYQYVNMSKVNMTEVAVPSHGRRIKRKVASHMRIFDGQYTSIKALKDDVINGGASNEEHHWIHCPVLGATCFFDIKSLPNLVSDLQILSRNVF